MAEPWTWIPKGVLADSERQDQADTWGLQQRKVLAQTWADQQRSWLQGLIQQAGQTMPDVLRSGVAGPLGTAIGQRLQAPAPGAQPADLGPEPTSMPIQVPIPQIEAPEPQGWQPLATQAMAAGGPLAQALAPTIIQGIESYGGPVGLANVGLRTLGAGITGGSEERALAERAGYKQLKGEPITPEEEQALANQALMVGGMHNPLARTARIGGMGGDTMPTMEPRPTPLADRQYAINAGPDTPPPQYDLRGNKGTPYGPHRVALDVPKPDESVVYHGTTLWGLPKLLDSLTTGQLKRSGNVTGLWVTDRPELAARYANAQVTRTVSSSLAPLQPGAVVVEIATTGPVKWFKRGLGYQGSLDAIEADIKQGRPLTIEASLPPYHLGDSKEWFLRTFGDRAQRVLDGGSEPPSPPQGAPRSPRIPPGGSTAMAVGGPALAAVPQQEGESDDAYHARLVAAGVLTAAGGVAMARTARLRTGNPAVDALAAMYRNPPKPPGSPVSGAEQLRVGAVRAITNRGVDADLLVEGVAKRTGTNLAPDEMMNYLARLDPVKQAEVVIGETMRPALQAVGADRETLSVYMTLTHNVDVANQMGVRAEQAALEQGLQRAAKATPTTGGSKLRLKQYEYELAKARAAGDKPKVAYYESSIKHLNDAARLSAETLERSKAQLVGRKITSQRQFSGGLDKATSEQGLTDLESALGPQRWQKVQDAAKPIWNLNQQMLQERLGSGIINQEQYDLLTRMYPHFTPTRILKYLDDEVARTPAGKSISLSENGLKRLTLEGTTEAREDPLLSTIRNVYMTKSAVVKNDAFNAFAKLWERDPELQAVVKQWSVGEKHAANLEPIMGFANGDKMEFVVPDYLANALKQEPIAYIQGINVPMAVWRAMLTSRNPAFLSANAMLDASTYMLREMTRGGGPQAAPAALSELLKSYAELVGDVAKGRVFRGEYGPREAAYLKAGGGMGGYTNIRPETGQKALDALSRRSAIEIKSVGDVGRLLKDLLTFEPVAQLGERIELAPRTASYNLAKRRGHSEIQSVINGRTVTIDFAQGGTFTKAVNQVIPFFNVSVQGGATLVRAARENPRGFAATMATSLIGPTLAAEAWNRSDPQRSQDYDDVPNYLKNSGLVLMIPGYAPEDAQGNRHPQFLHIRTREFSPFVIAAREATNRVMGRPGQSWQTLASGMASSVGPIQSTDAAGLLSSVLPPGISTGVELWANKDLYRGAAIATERRNEMATGPSQAVAGALGVQPSQAEYAFRDLTGGPGQMAIDVANAAAGRPSQSAGPQGVPVAGQFLKRFVRGEIGAGLEQARQQTVTPETLSALKQAGVSYVPSPVKRDIEGVPLLVAEQAQYQVLVNRYTEEGLQRMFHNPNWARLKPDQKEEVVKDIVDAARERAGAETLRSIGPGEIRQRVRKAG